MSVSKIKQCKNKSRQQDTTTYFWNSHSLLSNGQTCLVLSQRDIQWKWKACCKDKYEIYKVSSPNFTCLLTLHTPQATVHSSLVAEAWLAWHSMHKSMMWFLQIAQLSTTISICEEIRSLTEVGNKYFIDDLPHAQRATAFH